MTYILEATSFTTDPARFKEIASRHPVAIDTFQKSLPTRHRIDPKGHLVIPGSVIEKCPNRDEVNSRVLDIESFMSDVTKANLLLGLSLIGDIKPISADLRYLPGFHITTMGDLSDLRLERREATKVFEEGEIERLNKESEEKRKSKISLRNNQSRKPLGDYRLFSEINRATSIEEITRNHAGSTIPALLSAPKCFTLAVISSNGLGLGSREAEEKLSTLTLVSLLLDQIQEETLTTGSDCKELRENLTTLHDIEVVLCSVRTNSNETIERSILILQQRRKAIMDEGLKLIKPKTES